MLTKTGHLFRDGESVLLQEEVEAGLVGPWCVGRTSVIMCCLYKAKNWGEIDSLYKARKSLFGWQIYCVIFG